MEDIEPGCEGAVAAMKDWIAALMDGNVDRLETILAPEYQFTCSPDIIPGGRLNKSAFIEMDKKIKNSTIEIRKLAARRFDDTVMTMVFAEVHEEVAGDLGPGMPDAAEFSAMVDGHVFAYASAWRLDGGQWVCTSHNVIATAR
ncbi:MAG: nuclear transport factor 2 family protein [Sphingobium sp.]